MICRKYAFKDCVEYCGLNNLPPGLEAYYEQFEDRRHVGIIDTDYLGEMMSRFLVPREKQEQLLGALGEIEADDKLSYFTRFLIWDLCNARKRYKDNDYQALEPKCNLSYGRFYSFLILLACVKPSMQMLQDRGVPIEYYEKIPYVPMEKQFDKWIAEDDVRVSDFPWDLNFYTCSIFWLDRFQFIPCSFTNEVSVYRNKTNRLVLALSHGNVEVRRDGQINGTNEIYDNGKFVTLWEEDEYLIQANPVNPMGFIERETVALFKKDWELALAMGDLLLAFHIPSGPGYTTDKVRQSMMLALEFYQTYFRELKIKGFWSESWLYDTRLSLILEPERSNIIQVQRQFYLYPAKDGDDMMLERVFGEKSVDLLSVQCKTSLQEKIVHYMKTGARFNTLSMFVLRDEASAIGENPYIKEEDERRFRAVVDSHLTNL